MGRLTDLQDDMKLAYETYTAYFWVVFSVGVIVAGALGTLFGLF